MSRFLMVHRKIMKLIKITITYFFKIKIAYVDATKDVGRRNTQERETRMIIKSDFVAG
jgi:hypothetical protein